MSLPSARPANTSPATSPAAGIAAMLLAAGRGERMRPLTDTTPKPLLRVQGKPLMRWHLEALARGGFQHVVVNTAWLGEQIEGQFKSLFVPQTPCTMREQLLNKEQEEVPTPLHLHYSHEGRDFGGALETAGGIVRALSLLCPHSTAPSAPASDVFWVLAGDVFAPDFAFRQADVDRFIASSQLAHLWLVPNPTHNPRGDFGLDWRVDAPHGVGLARNLSADSTQARYTYSTIGLYKKALFEAPFCSIAAGNPLGEKAPLAPLLRAAMDQGLVSAELYTGRWTDVGTPQRLEQLNTPAVASPAHPYAKATAVKTP